MHYYGRLDRAYFLAFFFAFLRAGVDFFAGFAVCRSAGWRTFAPAETRAGTAEDNTPGLAIAYDAERSGNVLWLLTSVPLRSGFSLTG
jgi:hypothetical protein